MDNTEDPLDPFTALILCLFILSLPFILAGILVILTTPVDRPDDRFQSQSFPSFVCEKFGGRDCDDPPHAQPTTNPATPATTSNTTDDNRYQNYQIVMNVNYGTHNTGNN